MGALASLGQREEVRKAIQSLRSSAEIVYGDPDHVDLVDGDAERGAFLSPVLLRAARGAVEPHDVEPFGPVSTVIDLRLRRRGDRRSPPAAGAAWSARWSPTTPTSPARSRWASRPGTAGSWCSTATTPASPPATARRCPSSCTAAPAAPAAARSSAASAACCTTCSAPRSRPRPTMMTAITGRWTTGSPRTEDGVHPFRKSLAELRIGDTIRSAPRTGHARGHRPLRRVHRRHVLRPHRPRGRGRRTRSSAASSRTATSSSRSPPASSSTPTRARCWPTSASTTCAS